MPLIQIHKEHLPHPTTITPSALISTKGMFEIQCDADIFLPRTQSIYVKGEFYYQPDNYYGIASRDDGRKLGEYKYYRYLFNADYNKGIGKYIQIGSTIDLTYHHFTSLSDSLKNRYDDEIENASKWSNGIGAVVSFDNRDNTLNPTRGWHCRLWTRLYFKQIGSRTNFNIFRIDIRKYWAPTESTVIAGQIYVDYSPDEDTPFHKLSTFGGTRLGRAIPHNLKYIDHFAWLTQGEIRFPLFWRIGATGWTAMGNASDNVSNSFDDIHLMAGAGLRFKVFPEHGLNLRLDGGFSSRGDKAIYFNIREAF